MSYVKTAISTLKNVKQHPIRGALAGYTLVEPAVDYAYARSEGHSVASSVGRGAATYLMYELFPGLGFGLLAKDMMEVGVQALGKHSQNAGKKLAPNANHNFGGYFTDNDAAYTMRQRGIQAIQNNGINARSVLGNEARMYSRGHYE